MRPEEARIVSHICGDGWVTSYNEKNSLQIVNGRRYRRDRIRYQIGYCNTEKTLLDQFKNDVNMVFGIKPIKIRCEIRFKSKRVFDRIKSLGGGNTREWFISNEIRTSKNNVKSEWLKAFFDDEATVDIKTGRIRIKSMNKKGLEQVKDMLNDFGVKSSITGPNIDKSMYLSISRIYSQKFKNKIGFSHPKKIRNLKEISSITRGMSKTIA